MFKEKIDLFHLYIDSTRNQQLNGKEIVVMAKRLLVFFLKDIVKYVFSFSEGHTKEIPDFREKKIVFANTLNNYEALKFLLNTYQDSLLVCCSESYVKRMSSSIHIRSLLNSVNFRKYFFLLYLAIHSKYRLRHYRLIVRHYTFVDEYIKLLQHNRPSCIFISNDHYPDSRALILSARKLGIKCIYIQHASVTKFFPPMRASHALLYGQYSEDIYRSIKGSEGVFMQVGNHRFDTYKEFILVKKNAKKIGVAFNTRNSIKEVLSLCEYLAQHFPPESIILRPHPGDRRKLETKFRTSSFANESSLDFLKGIAVLVAGNSSILLEAALMNVYPLQIYFEKVPDFLVDYYGFIKDGIAIEIRSREELVLKISDILTSERLDCRARAKVYDASVGEEFEFQVEKHIISVIEKILDA